MKWKAILQLALAAAESQPWVFTFPAVTQLFFHANAHRALCMHLISHTSPQSSTNTAASKVNSSQEWLPCCYVKKQDFLIEVFVPDILKSFNCSLNKMLLFWPLWTAPNLLQHVEMKERTDCSDLPEGAASLERFKWKGQKCDTSGYFYISLHSASEHWLKELQPAVLPDRKALSTLLWTCSHAFGVHFPQ